MALTDAPAQATPLPDEGPPDPPARAQLPPWMPVERLVTLVVLLGSMAFTFWQLHPSLLFARTTPAGGDMGAHVWAPAFLRDHLLPSLRLTGWTKDWYAGFPAFHYYMVLPSLAIVALDVVLPYGVAFKLVAVSGLLALPVAVYLFGRLARLPFPGPQVLAAATVPFLFDRSFSIYGGNVPSTLAGEFAFSVSLSLALVFLGFVARGLENGRHRATAAALLAVTGLCHATPAFFAVAGCLVMVAFRFPVFEWRDPGYAARSFAQRVRWALPVLAVAGALAGFWILPFLLRLPYTNDMGWEKITT